MFEAFLKSVKEVAEFSGEELEALLNSLEIRACKKGEHFLEEGMVSRYVAYLDEGLTMHYRNQDGVEAPADFTRAGEWVAYLKSFSEQSPSDMAIKALEDCRFFCISYEKMGQLFARYPSMMALRNHQVERSFIETTRHATHLATLSAKERYYKLMQDKPDLVNRVPQYYLASYLGMKPQSLSRIRKESTK